MFRNSLRHGATGPYLAMDPAMIQQVVDAANAQFGSLPATAQKPVILCDGDIGDMFAASSNTTSRTFPRLVTTNSRPCHRLPLRHCRLSRSGTGRQFSPTT